MDRTKFLMEHFGLTKRPNPTYKQYFTFGELQKLLINYEKAINYSRCCKSDSEQLKDKKTLSFKEWKKVKNIKRAMHGYYKWDETLIKSLDVLSMYRSYTKNINCLQR